MTDRYLNLLLGYEQNNKVIILVTVITLLTLAAWYALGWLPVRYRKLGRILLGTYAIGLYLVALFGPFIAPLISSL